MKKTISVLAIGLLGLVGTSAFAGSDREETVDRLHNSVEEMCIRDRGTDGDEVTVDWTPLRFHQPLE